MFKLAQDAGHGRYTAGKRCDKRFDPNETREWVLNDRVARKVAKLLTENYEDVEILRVDDVTGETDVDIYERAAIANKWGADMYQSYHHNAGIKGGKGGGIVIYVQKKPTQTELEWQQELYDALVAETGLKGNRSEPLGKSNFVVIRDAEMDAVLMELGFMDSAVDTPIILTEEYADQCARAIAAVTARRAKLTPKGTCSSGSGSAPKPEPVPEIKAVNIDDPESFNKAYAGTYLIQSDDGILNLRSGAGSKKTLVEAMKSGQRVYCQGEYTGKWLLVVSENHRYGYCHKSYLKKI